MVQEPSATTERFKALGDPVRWNILQQIAAQEELACSILETTLPVSKPTISYHTKILAQAGLIEVFKRGRNYYYKVHREALRQLVDDLWALAPGPRLVGEPAPHREPAAPREAPRARPETAVLRKAVGDDTTPRPATLLTW